MKTLFISSFLFVTSVFAQAQSLGGLDVIMKEKVGAPFKIVFTHIMKQNQIDPAGSTLSAAMQAKAGLIEAASKAPSQLLNERGEIKDAAAMAIFNGYQMGMRVMIADVTKLIEILSAKITPDQAAAQVDAAKAQLQIIVRGQKKAHEDFKEE